MKKSTYAFIVIIILILSISFGLAGCNRQVLDLTYEYDKAILTLPNGEVIDGEVQSWRDYEDGDQIQVKVDGKTYLIHSSNVVLVAE